jgi:hypothetical protein
VGPEQLIIMATCQLRRRLWHQAAPPLKWRPIASNNALDHHGRAGTVRPPRIRSYNRAQARTGMELTVASHLARRSARAVSCRVPTSV